MSSVAAVILAAGASTRFGRPKQLALLSSETLLGRTVRVAREAGCSPLIVVLGAHADHVRHAAGLESCDILTNPDWREGMASSVACGVHNLRDVSGAVILTCDMPSVDADHLRLLVATGDLTASLYGGRVGVPAFFPASMFPQLTQLRGDAGARDLLQSARAVDLPNGALDIDTEQDLDRATEIVSSR